MTPVLVFRVQGFNRFADLRARLGRQGVDTASGGMRGAWYTLRARMDYGKATAAVIGQRVSVKPCGCHECASRIATGLDCMGVRP